MPMMLRMLMMKMILMMMMMTQRGAKSVVLVRHLCRNLVYSSQLAQDDQDDQEDQDDQYDHDDQNDHGDQDDHDDQIDVQLGNNHMPIGYRGIGAIITRMGSKIISEWVNGLIVNGRICRIMINED